MPQFIPKVRILLQSCWILIDVSSLRALLSQASIAAIIPLTLTLQLYIQLRQRATWVAERVPRIFSLCYRDIVVKNYTTYKIMILNA